MAVIAGFALGCFVGYLRRTSGLAVLLVAPLALAVVEVVVNGRKYGWGAVPLWSVVLISLTVTGTFLGRSAGRRLVAWRERRRA